MEIIHKDTKDVISRTHALCIAFGWQGGTIHQIAEITGCDAHDLIYSECAEHDSTNKAGWFAYHTCSLEHNQNVLMPLYKGNLQFWLGVAGGVQTAIKLKEDTPKKF